MHFTCSSQGLLRSRPHGLGRSSALGRQLSQLLDAAGVHHIHPVVAGQAAERLCRADLQQ